MFYGEECVSKLIKCSMCKSKLKDAKILPCGVYCNECVTGMTRNANAVSRDFECESCPKTHIVPEDGFMSWKALDEFYSEELTFEEIYRGESAEKLKNGLHEVRKQINMLNFSLTNSADAVKEHCLKLKNQVILETEIAVKQIKDLSENLLSEISDYEAKCISNFETDRIKKEKFGEFIDEFESLHQEWSDYLKKYRIKESETDRANNLLIEMGNRFLKEKSSLDQLIFNHKLMHYKPGTYDIGKNFLGNLELRTIGAIDIEKFQMVNLKDVLLNFHTSNFIHDLDAFENGKVVVVYPNTSNLISIAVIDQTRAISKSTHLSYYFVNTQMRVKTINGFLIFYYMNNSGQHCLVLMNSNLQLIESEFISYQVLSIDANANSIYCLTNTSTHKIMIFDHQLTNIRNIGQYSYPDQAFYLTNQVIRVSHKKNKFYCLYNDKLEIINETTGVVLKSIPIRGERMAFDSQENLLVLSVTSSKIFEYNLEGVLIDEIEIENAPTGLEFSTDEQSGIVYFNRTQSTFYFEPERK